MPAPSEVLVLVSYGKISPKRAPIRSLIVIWYMENPVKPSFSVRVENTLNYRFVYQNKADLHPSQCLLMALQSMLFLPLSLSHPDPLNPARTAM